MSDTTPDAVPPDEVPEVEEDDRVWVLVEVASVPQGEPVEVPGLGLFENGTAKPVDDVQLELFKQQGFDVSDAEDSRELHIRVPADPVEEPEEVSFEDEFEESGFRTETHQSTQRLDDPIIQPVNPDQEV
jgi:hypothetical protein